MITHLPQGDPFSSLLLFSYRGLLRGEDSVELHRGAAPTPTQSEMKVRSQRERGRVSGKQFN